MAGHVVSTAKTIKKTALPYTAEAVCMMPIDHASRIDA